MKIKTFQVKATKYFIVALKSDDRNESIASTKTSFEVPIVRRKSESDGFFYTDLKESVGHTEIEVVAGALLGFFVSLAVCTI